MKVANSGELSPRPPPRLPLPYFPPPPLQGVCLFLRDWWNVFDLLVVVTGIADALYVAILDNGDSLGLSIFRVCRIFRGLRVLRLGDFILKLRVLFNAITEVRLLISISG